MNKAKRKLKRWHKSIEKKVKWNSNIKGMPCIFWRSAIFQYKDTIIAGGIIQEHPDEKIYLEMKRFENKGNDVVVYMERNEAMAIINVLSSALWSEQIFEREKHK